MARVTIGIPVYNGADEIGATIESVLSQTFTDVEVLIVDNASTDETETICTRLADRDARVRYVRNDTNIGQNANFSKVYELARGTEFFRWMGDDDWLSPTYVEACVEAFDAHDDAAVVTTYQAHVKPDHTAIYHEYTGARPDSSNPIARLAAMLRLLTASRYYIDPVYSMVRMSHLTDEPPIRKMRFGDQLLACELAISGPYIHVPECLAFRSWAPLPKGRKAYTQYTGGSSSRAKDVVSSSSQRLLMMNGVTRALWSDPGLSFAQRVHGTGVVGGYGLRAASIRVWRKFASTVSNSVDDRDDATRVIEDDGSLSAIS